MDTEYALGVNEPYTLYEGFIPKERLLAVDLSEPFPEIAENIDIVFDLGGSISRNSHSIVSAIQQSDIVIIPIHDERKSIHSGIMTISEVLRFNQNILIVATKLRKNATESWEQCGSIKNIKTEIQKELNIELPTLPLKLSTAFDTIFDSEKSIRQLVEL